MDEQKIAQLDHMVNHLDYILNQSRDVARLHVRALACHCECMGMNAENFSAVNAGGPDIPYSDAHYYQTMQKWGLIDDKGEPTKEV